MPVDQPPSRSASLRPGTPTGPHHAAPPTRWSALAGFPPTLLVAVRALAAVTLLCGVLYPLVVTVAGRGLFDDRADGSLVRDTDGDVVGSELIGATLTGDEWFHARPSAAGPAAAGAVADVDLEDRASTSSAASNLGPDNPDLAAAVAERAAAYRSVNGLAPGDPVPLDAVTASGSGLDPHISEANARLQAPRVAEARGLDLDTVLGLVDGNLDEPVLGVLGTPVVNVSRLNVALDSLDADASGDRAGDASTAAHPRLRTEGTQP